MGSRATENEVGGVAGAALEVTAAEMTLVLHVADHGLDGRTASEIIALPSLAASATSRVTS
jgi:hypothetical protein